MGAAARRAGYACYFGINQTGQVVDLGSRGEQGDVPPVGSVPMPEIPAHPQRHVNMQPGVRWRIGEGERCFSVVLERKIPCDLLVDFALTEPLSFLVCSVFTGTGWEGRGGEGRGSFKSRVFLRLPASCVRARVCAVLSVCCPFFFFWYTRCFSFVSGKEGQESSPLWLDEQVASNHPEKVSVKLE